ncbi:unnamed protein product [Mucor hiemalis]
MATLNAFGFTPRKGRSSSQHLPTKVVDKNPSAAFCQPIDIKSVLASPHNNNNNNNKNIQTRKTSNGKAKRKGYGHINSENNKITHYFNTTNSMTTNTPMDIDNNVEEGELTCVIRKKVPFCTLFCEIEKDYLQELLMIDEEEEEELYSLKKRSKCKRYIQFQEEDRPLKVVKRQKITLDTDLSSAMSKFLNIKSNILLASAPQLRIECLNEYRHEEDDDKEDLKRFLRYKMSKEESSLFVLQITQEYLS